MRFAKDFEFMGSPCPLFDTLPFGSNFRSMKPSRCRSQRSFWATITPPNNSPLPSRDGPGTVLAGLWLAVLWSAAGSVAHAQGCVAGGFCPLSPISPPLPGDVTDSLIAANHWQASLAYRWFRSDRHFVGDVEQPQRQALGTEVINDVHSFDLSLTYGITPRWSVTLTVPFIDADR